MYSDRIHDSVWCAERRGRTPARSTDAAIVKDPTYGRGCRLANGIYGPRIHIVREVNSQISGLCSGQDKATWPLASPRGSILAATHRGFALITRTNRCLRQLPCCVAVYPRDSQSRRVLCRWSSTPFTRRVQEMVQCSQDVARTTPLRERSS